MKIFVFCNLKDKSRDARERLLPLLDEFGYEVLESYSEDADLLACIGGDGTFLSFVHKCGFPSAPIIGINTGHLGFFQEALPGNLRETLEYITKGEYQLQNVLYYLYFPDFFTYGHGAENLDTKQYESMRQSVLKMMAEKGYTEQELADIYHKHADSYGYTNVSELEAYVKE